MKTLTFLPLAILLAARTAVSEIQVTSNFRWTDPFVGEPAPKGFDTVCEAENTLPATQHILTELADPLPRGLAPWADAIKYFFGGRPFPGSWEGIDEQGPRRDIIRMEYTDVPVLVRRWIEEQRAIVDGDGRWLFAVCEKPTAADEDDEERVVGVVKGVPSAVVEGGEEGELEDGKVVRADNLVVLFAAGAAYQILPLWAAAGSECESDLVKLENYKAAPEDEAVVGWVVDRSTVDWDSDVRDITFKVKVQVVKENEEGREARLAREKEKEESDKVAAEVAEIMAREAAERAEAEKAEAEGTGEEEKVEEEAPAQKDEL